MTDLERILEIEDTLSQLVQTCKDRGNQVVGTNSLGGAPYALGYLECTARRWVSMLPAKYQDEILDDMRATIKFIETNREH